MSAAAAIAAVEDLAVRVIHAESLLRKVAQNATPTAEGWQVPADALEQVRAYLRGEATS